jgi:hypothetical protein
VVATGRAVVGAGVGTVVVRATEVVVVTSGRVNCTPRTSVLGLGEPHAPRASTATDVTNVAAVARVRRETLIGHSG